MHTDAEGNEVARKVILDYGPQGADNAGEHVPDATVVKEIEAPEGAAAVRFEFRYFDAGNNWFWAIDNVRVAVDSATDPEDPTTPDPSSPEPTGR